MCYVYVLRSEKNGKLYSGHTENLEKRLIEHNCDRNNKRFSWINGPWVLLFSESFNTRSEAMQHERFFRTGKGRKYIQDILILK
ncbi:MAG: GIY-YIG nuclease family protein [Candidatus Omnitrophota bacterium]